MGYESLKDEAAIFTDRFKYLFRIKFGTQPIVHYTLGLPFYGKIKLEELAKICSEVLNEKVHIKIPEGIACKRRIRVIVEHRQCFFKIARDLGYSLSVISSHIGYNHATAINGIKKIKERLENKDRYTNFIMRDLLKAIHEYQLAQEEVIETYEKETFMIDGDII